MATIGQYKGTDITRGTDAEVAEQMRRIDSIPAGDIQPTEPVSVPTPTATSSGQTIDQIAQETRQQSKQAEQEFVQSKTSMEDRVKEITGVMGSRDALEEEQGLGQARLDTADIRNQIEAREHSLRRAIEQTQKTAGLSGTQINRQVQALNRDAARELADLSIIESARLRRMDAIETNIDRKISAQLEPLQFQLQFDMMFYQENRQAMTAAQDRAFNMKIAMEERNYQEKQQESNRIKDIALSAAQYGATGEQIKQITDATSFDEAMSQGASFLGEPFRLQVQAQDFAQKMQREQMSISYAQLDLARDQVRASKDAAADALEMQIRQMSREDMDMARKDQRVTNFETIQSLKNAVDQELSKVESEDGTIDWMEVAKSNSSIYAIANAAARSQNPDMTRAMGDLGLTDTAGLNETRKAIYNKLLKDATANPGKLVEMYTLLDSAHTSAMGGMQDALTSLQTTIPGFVIKDDMFVNRSVTADAYTEAAVQNQEIMNAPAQPIQKNDPFSNLINDWLGGFNN